MRYHMAILTTAILIFQISCSSFASRTISNENQVKAQRRPFQRNNLVLKSPEDYAKRDLPNGKEYDPKPTIRLVDEGAGKYEFSWIGYDKKKKIVIYQREDVINATVEAMIEKDSEGRRIYQYLIKNSPESPTYLRDFIVQTISADVKPIKMENIYIGEMSNDLRGYTEGLWKAFAILETFPRVNPGKSIEFRLTSSALPGLVGCKAAAGQGYTIGVGEHMPEELDRLVPVNLWAKGYTIGPIDKLATLSKPERAKYILDNLPQFVEAGWMAGDTPKIYQAILEQNDLAAALEQAKKDLDKGYLTSEAFYIIEGLNQ